MMQLAVKMNVNLFPALPFISPLKLFKEFFALFSIQPPSTSARIKTKIKGSMPKDSFQYIMTNANISEIKKIVAKVCFTSAVRVFDLFFSKIALLILFVKSFSKPFRNLSI